jgi:hypothetical protein
VNRILTNLIYFDFIGSQKYLDEPTIKHTQVEIADEIVCPTRDRAVERYQSCHNISIGPYRIVMHQCKRSSLFFQNKNIKEKLFSMEERTSNLVLLQPNSMPPEASIEGLITQVSNFKLIIFNIRLVNYSFLVSCKAIKSKLLSLITS